MSDKKPSQCHLCQDRYLQINLRIHEMRDSGATIMDVLAFCTQNNIKTSKSAVGRHLKYHVDPYVNDFNYIASRLRISQETDDPKKNHRSRKRKAVKKKANESNRSVLLGGSGAVEVDNNEIKRLPPNLVPLSREELRAVSSSLVLSAQDHLKDIEKEDNPSASALNTARKGLAEAIRVADSLTPVEAKNLEALAGVAPQEQITKLTNAVLLGEVDTELAKSLLPMINASLDAKNAAQMNQFMGLIAAGNLSMIQAARMVFADDARFQSLPEDPPEQGALEHYGKVGS